MRTPGTSLPRGRCPARWLPPPPPAGGAPPCCPRVRPAAGPLAHLAASCPGQRAGRPGPAARGRRRGRRWGVGWGGAGRGGAQRLNLTAGTRAGVAARGFLARLAQFLARLAQLLARLAQLLAHMGGGADFLRQSDARPSPAPPSLPLPPLTQHPARSHAPPSPQISPPKKKTPPRGADVQDLSSAFAASVALGARTPSPDAGAARGGRVVRFLAGLQRG